MKLRCPYCDYLQTEHETLKGETNAIDGDISFCINCGEVSEFKEGKTIKINEEDLDAETKKEFNRIRHAWLRVRARQSASSHNIK